MRFFAGTGKPLSHPMAGDRAGNSEIYALELPSAEGLVAKNGVVMKTEAIHPFFSEPT